MHGKVTEEKKCFDDHALSATTKEQIPQKKGYSQPATVHSHVLCTLKSTKAATNIKIAVSPAVYGTQAPTANAIPITISNTIVKLTNNLGCLKPANLKKPNAPSEFRSFANALGNMNNPQIILITT